MILGWVFNKPVFPFEYSSKTSNLLKDLGYDGYHLSLKDIINLDVERVVEQLIQKNPPNIKKEQKEAENHFLKTDEFLVYKI